MRIAIGLLTCTLLVQQVYSVGVPSEVGKFNVVGGQPCVVIRGDGPSGNALDHRGEALVHYGSGQPLAYPIDGESKVVRLGTNAGSKAMGSKWMVSKIGGRGGSEIVTIQAAEGQFKGWYLDGADEEETITSEGRTITIRPLVLVEKPKYITRFERYPVSK